MALMDAQKEGRQRTVLVVEDDLNTAEVIKEMLEIDFGGIYVAHALDGHEALTHIEQRAPSLLVLNMMMPGMGGAEVLGALWAKNLSIPTIVTSGFIKSKEEVSRLAGVPADRFEFFKKPFDVRTFIDAVRRLLADSGS